MHYRLPIASADNDFCIDVLHTVSITGNGKRTSFCLHHKLLCVASHGHSLPALHSFPFERMLSLCPKIAELTDCRSRGRIQNESGRTSPDTWSLQPIRRQHNTVGG